jgi:hypothetical protein
MVQTLLEKVERLLQSRNVEEMVELGLRLQLITREDFIKVDFELEKGNTVVNEHIQID